MDASVATDAEPNALALAAVVADNSLIRAVNGPVIKQQFITEVLYKEDPLSDAVLVKSGLSVPTDRSYFEIN